jgi:ferrous iron transport protein B
VVVGTVLANLALVGYGAGRLMPGHSGDFIIELPPVRMPRPYNILKKTLTRSQWYLREAVPLFVLGSLLLFTLDRTGGLHALIHGARPAVVGMLGLPAEAAEALVMGFLRRDYGAVIIREAASAHTGGLTHTQLAVALSTLVLFVPCVASFLVMVKERGLGTSMAILGFVAVYSMLAGGLLRLVLTLIGFDGLV